MKENMGVENMRAQWSGDMLGDAMTHHQPSVQKKVAPIWPQRTG